MLSAIFSHSHRQPRQDKPSASSSPIALSRMMQSGEKAGHGFHALLRGFPILSQTNKVPSPAEQALIDELRDIL